MAYLGFDCLKTHGLAADTQKTGMKSLGKGTIVKPLNPTSWPNVLKVSSDFLSVILKISSKSFLQKPFFAKNDQMINNKTVKTH